MTATITGLADKRACAQCHEVKPISEFRIRPNGNGVRYPRRICKACENGNQRADLAWRARATARARAERAVSGEITALIRATTARCGAPKPPLPTAEQLAVWHRKGCPIAPHQRRRAAA